MKSIFFVRVREHYYEYKVFVFMVVTLKSFLGISRCAVLFSFFVHTLFYKNNRNIVLKHNLKSNNS